MVDSMKMSNDSNYRLGIDVGGTFTDFSLFEEHTETLINFKVPTTPNDPSEGIIDGIKGIIWTMPCLQQKTDHKEGNDRRHLQNRQDRLLF